MLHILNGDTTAHALNNTSIRGEKIIWREALSQGPVAKGLGKEQFRALRADYICNTYQENPGAYMDKVALEEDRLEQWLANGQDEEVILWFDCDLMCQVNLWYLLSTFNFNPRKISMVTNLPNCADIRGLGALDSPGIEAYFNNRCELDVAEIEAARLAWDAYTAQTPEASEELINKEPHYLNIQGAMQAHLLRLPGRRTGLSLMEEKLITWINAGLGNRAELIAYFLNEDTTYGYGDLQVEELIDRMGALIDIREDESLEVNKTGRSVLMGNEDFMDMRIEPLRIAGMVMAPGQPVWRWDWEKSRLILE